MRRFAIAALAAGLALQGPAGAAAQQSTGTVTGRITEAGTDRPLISAQLVVGGTTRGTLTDAEGRYVLSRVPAGSQTIRVTVLGYSEGMQRVVVPADGSVSADFALSQTAIALDEVVITGTPGATQKRAIGNSVSTIKAADVTAVAPMNTVTQLLQARTPGLTIMSPSGTAGTASNIRIRGVGSYQGGNQPVFYIDGIRMQAGGQGGFGVGGQSTSALDALNPEDIETIEVIKGPAAATLYGADAAAGVIQVITKKGSKGQQSIRWKAKVDYGRTDWNAEMPTNYTLCTAARIASSAWPGCAGLDPNAPDAQRILSGQPLKDVLRDGRYAAYNLSATGGGERYSFYVAGEKEDEDGVFANNYFDRTSGRANFAVTPSEKVDLNVSLGYTRSFTRLPQNDNSSNGWLRNSFRGFPGNGPWELGWRGLGPDQMDTYDNVTRAERFILGSTVNYQPFPWLKNRLTAGLDAGTRLATLFYSIDRTGRQPFGGDAAQGYIDQYAPQTRNWTLDYSGTISKDVSPALSSDLSVGMQFNAYRFESLESWGIGLLSDSTRLVSSANQTFGAESRSETRSLGFFAQEQVGWRNRLFLTGALRMDNSSVFGSDIKRIFYPKVSASYVVSDEPWFHVPALDNLRLRAAWGQAGNAPDPFSADRNYTAGTVILDNGVFASVLRANAYGNPGLKAERGSEVELGFESSVLKGRIGVDFTYYNKTTHDALVTIPVSPSSGFTGSTLRNLGEINNKGIELLLSGTPIQSRPLVWDVRVGVATNSNTWVTFNGSRDEPILQGYGGGAQQIHEGYPMGAYWAQKIALNADGTPKLSSNGRPILEDTASYIGPSAPTREASLTNTFTLFRNLRVYSYLDYKGGHHLFNMTAQTRDADGNSFEATHMDPAEFALRRFGGNYPYIEKADFLRLREVSLSYSVPTRLVRRVGVQGLDLTLSGRNLALWTKYSGPDPETNIEGNATFTRGDYMSVPALRRIVTSVNVRF